MSTTPKLSPAMNDIVQLMRNGYSFLIERHKITDPFFKKGQSVYMPPGVYECYIKLVDMDIVYKSGFDNLFDEYSLTELGQTIDL